MSSKKDDIQKEIEDKFRVMLQKADSNPQLKKEVMSTIARIENLSILVDLFTVKLAQTEGSIISGISGDLTDDTENHT